MNPNQSYPSTGEVIDGKYQIERMLGEGGMGAVAKATHLLRRAPVALKFMSPNVMTFPGAVERFLNEGVAASQIESDHVVHIFDVGKLASGAPYLVMEYMEGCDLAEVLAREGQPGLEIARSVYFIVQTLRGLQVAHDAGIIHRDMKPSNCFVINKEGEPDFVKLLDFGISKVGQGKSASLTQTNSALGTPLYMSPEQARSPRDVDLRSDIYSVGVILYELLTGRTPFNSESGEFTEILFKLFTQEPPPVRSFRPDLPPQLAAAVHKALARDVGERYATAAEFGLALEPFSDGRSARVLSRLRAHQPGRGSQLPSDARAGAPVAAFSNLSSGVQVVRTHEIDARPPAAAAPPLVGHAQPLAPSVATAQTPMRASAFPPSPSARVGSAAEAVAATHYSADSLAHPPAPPATPAGKSTDLGASRDTSVPGVHPPGKKTSPLAFVIPAAFLVGVGGVAVWKMSGSAPAAHGTSTMTADPSPPPPTLSIAATAPAPPAPSVEPAAPEVVDAGVAAVAPQPTTKKVPTSSPPPPSPPSDGRKHIKDLNIKE